MIPTWPQAIDAALANIKPRRAFYVVDFWDQGGWPGWFRGLLKKWLDLFHVVLSARAAGAPARAGRAGRGQADNRVGRGRYAYLATFRKLS